MRMAVLHLSAYGELLLYSIFIILIILAIGYIIPIVSKQWRILSAVRKLPRHPNEHWFWGHLPVSMTGDSNTFVQLTDVLLPEARKGHKLTVVNFGPTVNFVHTMHPDTIKPVLGPDPKLHSVYFALNPWLGDGLLTSNGMKWSRHRRLLTHAFHFDILKPYVAVYSDCASVLIEQLSKQEIEVDVVPFMKLYTLDVLLRCICGQQTNCQVSGKHSPYVNAVYTLSDLSRERMLKDEDGNGLSDLEIREQVDTFMFGGHDTTANSLCWILYLLAKHPEHQDKCREEIDTIFKEKDEIEWDDLKSLDYLKYCIKESNRLYPPVPAVCRELAESKTFDGYTLPKGTWIAINIYTVHHNPHVWNEPEKFDALRFTPENSEDRHPLAYVPFSAGPRNCIGQEFALHEEKVALATILRHYEITVDENYTVKPKRVLLLQPENGLHLKLKKRQFI